MPFSDKFDRLADAFSAFSLDRRAPRGLRLPFGA
jgi:hypothetical protein